MTTDLAADREAIVEVIGANFTPEELRDHAEIEERAELEKRRRSFSVEALAGDPEAVAALEKIEAELTALDRRQELRKLAEVEAADRARVAAEAETERKRDVARKAKAKIDKQRTTRLAAIESALDSLVDAVVAHAEAECDSERHGKQIDQGYRHPRWFSAIEDRFSFRLREIGLNELGYPLGPRGQKPLGED